MAKTSNTPNTIATADAVEIAPDGASVVVVAASSDSSRIPSSKSASDGGASSVVPLRMAVVVGAAVVGVAIADVVGVVDGVVDLVDVAVVVNDVVGVLEWQNKYPVSANRPIALLSDATTLPPSLLLSKATKNPSSVQPRLPPSASSPPCSACSTTAVNKLSN